MSGATKKRSDVIEREDAQDAPHEEVAEVVRFVAGVVEDTP
jgi:hypothetical protein